MAIREELIKLFKYYKGEGKTPYSIGSIEHMWWDGEKALCDTASIDPTFFPRIMSSLKEAIRDNGCSGVLVDNSVSLERRAIIFYLDLWHGKTSLTTT